MSGNSLEWRGGVISRAALLIIILNNTASSTDGRCRYRVVCSTGVIVVMFGYIVVANLMGVCGESESGDVWCSVRMEMWESGVVKVIMIDVLGGRVRIAL